MQCSCMAGICIRLDVQQETDCLRRNGSNNQRKNRRCRIRCAGRTMKALYVMSSTNMTSAKLAHTHDSGGNTGSPKMDRLRIRGVHHEGSSTLLAMNILRVILACQGTPATS